MMKYMRIIIISVVITAVGAAGSFAAFKDNGWGARSAGMGGAFTAVADDADAALYNPAGLMQLKAPEGSFMYSKLYTGLDGVDLGLNYLSYVHPTSSIGSFGINWANFTADGLYREDTLTISYAQSINEFYADLGNEYLVGLNLKYLRNSFSLDSRTVDDPVFAAGRSADNFALDLGMMVNFYEEAVGFSVKNINEPDVGLKTREVAYREYRLGFAYLLGDFWVLEEALPAADISYRNKEIEYHFGWENWFYHRTFALRLGGNRDEADMGFGYAHDLGASGMVLEFNYALLWPLAIKETSGSHRASVTLRFAGSHPEKLMPVSVPETSSRKPTIARKVLEIFPKELLRKDTRGLAVNLSRKVAFDPGRTTLKGSSLKVLDELAELLNAYPKNFFIIEGHTDSIGSMISNKRLSETRAHSIYTYFASRGVEKSRMRIIGYGETKPIADNKTSSGRSKNRRVEIIILKTAE